MPADVFAAMGFSPRLRTAFAKASITVIGDITAKTAAQLLDVRGISPVGLHEIEIILESHRLSLAPRQIGGDRG